MSSKSTTGTPTTLALIPYLNCEPFYGTVRDLGLEIVHEPPRVLGEMAARGVPTCGVMAVADWFGLQDRYEPLGELGISCEGPAHSVLLFARREIARLGNCRVGLTNESSTSVRLVKLILERKYGAEGIAFERGEAAGDEGRLLIGDAALRAACHGLDGFPFVYDLGEEWYGWQGLPFVFARWVVSTQVPEGERLRILESLETSLDGWPARLPEIAARRGPEFDLDEDGIREYLETFQYRLGPLEAMGERTFRSLLNEEDGKED
jgi:chorismate dehydratase